MCRRSFLLADFIKFPPQPVIEPEDGLMFLYREVSFVGVFFQNLSCSSFWRRRILVFDCAFSG